MAKFCLRFLCRPITNAVSLCVATLVLASKVFDIFIDATLKYDHRIHLKKMFTVTWKIFLNTSLEPRNEHYLSDITYIAFKILYILGLDVIIPTCWVWWKLVLENLLVKNWVKITIEMHLAIVFEWQLIGKIIAFKNTAQD